MTENNQDAIDSLTERVNRLYNQVFTIPKPADSIKKVILIFVSLVQRNFFSHHLQYSAYHRPRVKWKCILMY